VNDPSALMQPVARWIAKRNSGALGEDAKIENRVIARRNRGPF
jgi:hypothetical protein